MIKRIEDLISFLRIFHRSWMDNPSLDASCVPENLPRALEMLYRELGGLIEIEPKPKRRGSPLAAQDELLPPSRLKLVDGMLEFAWENQGCWSCRCPSGKGDVPVFSNAPAQWSADLPGFTKVCDSLEHFLITLCLQEAVMSAPALMAVNARPLHEIFLKPVEPIWLNGFYVQMKPSHNFFVVPGEDVLIMKFGKLWVGAHEPNSIDVIRPSSRTRLHR